VSLFVVHISGWIVNTLYCNKVSGRVECDKERERAYWCLLLVLIIVNHTPALTFRHHLGFIIRIYHDTRSPVRQISLDYVTTVSFRVLSSSQFICHARLYCYRACKRIQHPRLSPIHSFLCARWRSSSWNPQPCAISSLECSLNATCHCTACGCHQQR